jgi:hypothetical protein
MCSNDSPSQKRDGAAEAGVQTAITTEQLQSDYGATIDDLRHTPLPDARIEELVASCVDMQQRLDTHGTVGHETVLELVTAVAEAIEQVRDATVVGDDELPDSRALDTGVPDEEYVLTPEERDETLGVLSAVLFTAVETPGVGDVTAATGVVQ